MSELVRAPESESEEHILIPLSAEVLKLKFKTPMDHLSICISNEKANQTKQLFCWDSQLRLYHFVKIRRWSWRHTENVWEMYGKIYSIKFLMLVPLYDLNLMYSKVVELWTALSLCSWPFLNPMVRLQDKLTIKHFLRENVWEMSQNFQLNLSIWCEHQMFIWCTLKL